jgi:hypothetical protein
MMKKLCAILLLFLASCVNPYGKFYQGMPDARQKPGYELVQRDLQIYSTDNFERDRLVLMRRGYVPIGKAAFNSASDEVSEAQLREQASKIGAHAVLISAKYTHTVSGAMPLALPQTTTSYSAGTATAYGRGGAVSAYGRGTTTTYSSQMVMMPYSVARSDFAALFFAKVKLRVGIVFAPLDDETRKRLQTNAGIKVLAVVEGSSAFQADVLPDDVVLAVGSDTVQSMENAQLLFDKHEGQTVPFRLARDGKIIEKQIEIRPYN